MSSKRKVFLAFCFCILNMFLLVGFCVIRDATMLNVLKKEERELLKLSMTSSRYTREIQSRGDYAIVEKSVKKYLDNYAVSIQDTLSIMDDDTLLNILSYDNYCQDGPSFSKSLNYLKSTKESFNHNIDYLISLSEEDTLRDGVSSKLKDSYYMDLYNQFMLSDDMKQRFSDNNILLSNAKIKVNHVIDVSVDVLNFLSKNQDSWKVEDGKIQFVTEDLYNQYMTYISKLA